MVLGFKAPGMTMEMVPRASPPLRSMSSLRTNDWTLQRRKSRASLRVKGGICRRRRSRSRVLLTVLRVPAVSAGSKKSTGSPRIHEGSKQGQKWLTRRLSGQESWAGSAATRPRWLPLLCVIAASASSGLLHTAVRRHSTSVQHRTRGSIPGRLTGTALTAKVLGE